ncbi:HEAT repeat domain-containing protein [Anatilimnocola sp. NA78]|uniref:HEAT repeat domain-containing protein n=1 Tax=Anatilimnocola sp. NA78 TaxID=3415683 RepID=UPI003CE57E2F
MARGSADKSYIVALQEVLNDLSKTFNRPRDPALYTKARSYFHSIPDDIRATVLDKAVGKSIKRFQVAAWLVVECDPPLPSVDEWIVAGLNDEDAKRHSWMIQVVGNAKLTRFAEAIAKIIATEGEARWWAVNAAAAMRGERCLPSLLELAEKYAEEETPFSLVAALSKFTSPLVIPHLNRVFESNAEERDRVAAARGLGRQGDQRAIEFLVAKLDEDDQGSQSRRAAQALSDLFGWEFEWAPGAQQIAKENWRRKQEGP